MTSEENKTGSKSEEKQGCDNIVSKNGLCLMGYTAPWWIVVVVLVLVTYILYDRNMLAGVGMPKVQRMMSVGGSYNLDKYQVPMTPEGYRALFHL